MRKILLVLLVVAVSLVGCGAETNASKDVGSNYEKAQEQTVIPTSEPIATSTPTQVPQHVCDNVCSTCGLCSDATCPEKACIEKCAGHEVLPKGNYITTEGTVVEIDSVVYHIGSNIYVPDSIESLSNVAIGVMEQVSGLQFDGNDNYLVNRIDKKSHIYITRDNLYAGMDWYTGWDSNELGSAYANDNNVWLAPGDLLLGNSYTIIHELAHVLMWRQSQWYHEKTLNEGFAEYTAYLTLLEMEEKHPEAAVYFDKSTSSVNSMNMSHEDLYKQPIEYWLNHPFEDGGNGNYSIGFRLMAYLQDVYGDYSSWIANFDKQYSFKDREQTDNVSPVEHRIAILKQTYGEDVLDNFYPWLKAHEDYFEVDYFKVIDRSGLQNMNLYPRYNSFEERMVLEDIKYKDLYINLEPARKYIGEYKGRDISKLVLESLYPLAVNLYKADGSFTQITIEDEPVSLEDITGIQLVGEGTLKRLEISGFHQCENKCSECGLCREEYCWQECCLDKCRGH